MYFDTLKRTPKPISMRITEIREKTVPIASAIANAYIDFSKMTCSLVAIVTNVTREGRRVVGYYYSCTRSERVVYCGL